MNEDRWLLFTSPCLSHAREGIRSNASLTAPEATMCAPDSPDLHTKFNRLVDVLSALPELTNSVALKEQLLPLRQSVCDLGVIAFADGLAIVSIASSRQ